MRQVYPEQDRPSERRVFWKYEVYALPANLPVYFSCPVSRRTKTRDSTSRVFLFRQ